MHTERVLQCLLSTSAVGLAAWVVLMFPCVEEMKRPVTLAGWGEARIVSLQHGGNP